jgi:hypothetical protein
MRYEISGGGKYILLPNIVPHSYKVIGWNWFNLEEGEWNSCLFETKEHAIEAYKKRGITKVKIKLDYSPEPPLEEELFEI